MDLELFEKKEVAKTPAADFVLRFKRFYETVTRQPYAYHRKDFVLSARLIKEHGLDAVIQKVRILAALCNRRGAWFTRDGYADFSIGRLSQWWNSILPDMVEDAKDRKHRELLERLKKNEEARAHV